MQYVRSISGSVSKTWNSINPATLSGAIDVIVVEHEDGTLACSPFHIRFGKFSLLRPHEKKVDFRVNKVKQDFPLKLAEGGEAFFVFETTNTVPADLQTSPLVSPAQSPELMPKTLSTSAIPPLADADPLDLATSGLGAAGVVKTQAVSDAIDIPGAGPKAPEPILHPLSASLDAHNVSGRTGLTPSLYRALTDDGTQTSRTTLGSSLDKQSLVSPVSSDEQTLASTHDHVPAASPGHEPARTRAINLSKKLWVSNIPSQVTETGDLMLDMTGYKSSEDEALRAEVIARKILSEELESDHDIGSLIGADDKGNLWIYGSEEAKEEADRRVSRAHTLTPPVGVAQTHSDTISDPGYHSDDAASDYEIKRPRPAVKTHVRHESDSAIGQSSRSDSPDDLAGEQSRNYAKTLRLTSEQLKSLELKPGQNEMSFTVNKATCTANLWLWRYDVPIIISDIDGTITKSDALGHVLNMIGRDWTHSGVAKLYTDIAANGYNILYLTSRSIGQADTTRTYLSGIVQEGGYRLPKGPVILSPDRTIAALRREVYLRKPEIFKMACLRDIMTLFQEASGSSKLFTDAPPLKPKESANPLDAVKPIRASSPFYAGFGNRLTDALSYRSVNIPSTRIFTINSSAEVTLDLLSLTTYKTGYTDMRQIVDHFFPPVGLLVKGGGEEFTDFNYWRDRPLETIDFSASESEDDEEELGDEIEPLSGLPGERMSEDEGTLNESFISDPDRDEGGRYSIDRSLLDSIIDEEEIDFDDGYDDNEGEDGDGDGDDGDDADEDEDEGADDQQAAGDLELDEPSEPTTSREVACRSPPRQEHRPRENETEAGSNGRRLSLSFR